MSEYHRAIPVFIAIAPVVLTHNFVVQTIGDGAKMKYKYHHPAGNPEEFRCIRKAAIVACYPLVCCSALLLPLSLLAALIAKCMLCINPSCFR